MGYEQVTDISTLQSRQDSIDGGWIESYNSVKSRHTSIDIDSILPSVIDRKSRGEVCGCDNCDSPLVSVESAATGDIVRVCRHCVNAIKLVSLIHKDRNIICIECRVKFNLDGMVAGAVHIGLAIEDGVFKDHPNQADGTVKPGLKSLITDGKVYLDPDTNSVRVDD